MMIINLIKIIIAALFTFLFIIPFIGSSLAEKTIQNVNTLLLSNKIRLSSNYPQEIYDESEVTAGIISRNVFNITGEIPPEDLEFSDETLNAEMFALIPCAPPSEPLPVELIGIIYSEDPKMSVVTVQDPDIEGADVYHEGDPLLDYNDYSVYRIVSSNLVEFKFGSKKICRTLKPSETMESQKFQNSMATKSSVDTSDAVILTQEYVNSELGTGLSKIVNTVRIVPSMENGKVNGFKVFSIQPNTLFQKIGFTNGDIITQINNQDLTDPTKGFLIYESFQYEHEITFTLKRGAETITRKVIIK